MMSTRRGNHLQLPEIETSVHGWPRQSRRGRPRRRRDHRPRWPTNSTPKSSSSPLVCRQEPYPSDSERVEPGEAFLLHPDKYPGPLSTMGGIEEQQTRILKKKGRRKKNSGRESRSGTNKWSTSDTIFTKKSSPKIGVKISTEMGRISHDLIHSGSWLNWAGTRDFFGSKLVLKKRGIYSGCKGLPRTNFFFL